MPNVFELDGVSKNYGKIVALEDLTIKIGDNPTAVLGYSGAGKTTMLKLLAGLDTPSAGTIRYRGSETNKKNLRSLRRVATMLFQEPIFFNRTVLENVTYGLSLREVNRGEANRKASETLTSLRLGGFENRKAAKLSGGEQQRTALALVLKPEVLLLDEPTSNLDPANAALIMEAILEFAKKGLVIVATHNFSQIRKLTSWAIYLENGRVVETGATDDLLDNPRDQRTMKFVNGLF